MQPEKPAGAWPAHASAGQSLVHVVTALAPSLLGSACGVALHEPPLGAIGATCSLLASVVEGNDVQPPSTMKTLTLLEHPTKKVALPFVQVGATRLSALHVQAPASNVGLVSRVVLAVVPAGHDAPLVETSTGAHPAGTAAHASQLAASNVGSSSATAASASGAEASAGVGRVPIPSKSAHATDTKLAPAAMHHAARTFFTEHEWSACPSAPGKRSFGTNRFRAGKGQDSGPTAASTAAARERSATSDAAASMSA